MTKMWSRRMHLSTRGSTYAAPAAAAAAVTATDIGRVLKWYPRALSRFDACTQ